MIKFRFLFLLVCVCAFHSLRAQNDTGSEIVSHSRHILMDGNKLISTDSVEVMIYDQRGEDRARIRVHYSKGDGVTVHYALIEDRYGRVVRKIRRSEITDANYLSNSSLYQDDFLKSFELKHNVYPYRVKYAYTVTENKYFYAGHLPYLGKTPVKKGVFVVRTAANRPVKYNRRNIAEPGIDTAGNQVTYTWHYSHTYQKPDIYMPEECSTAPSVTVLPVDFTYGVAGNWASWSSFGNYIWRLNAGMDKLPDTEKAKIDQLLQGVEDKREQVRILYHYLQDYNRYVNVKLGVGGLKSYPASYVCANRFGDCKALSNYMVSILKHAGIEAYYTLVELSRTVPYIDESFPDQVFDHVIVTVPLQNDTLYLECTSTKEPFAYLGTYLQGRKALLVKERGSELIGLPALTPGQVACTTLLEADLRSGQNAKITMDAVARGGDFEFFNARSEISTRNLTEIFMRNYLFRGTFELGDYQFHKTDRDSDSIRLTVSGEIRDFYRQYGKNVSLQPFAFYLPVFEEPGVRHSPVKLDYPRKEHYTVRYRLPEGFSAPTPPPVTIESPYGSYRSVSQWEQGTLTVNKTLILHAGRIEIEDYPQFFSFITRIRRQENSSYNLEIR